jgi:ABC-type Fe3+/spermidine/putrescine transport system ATPase subunit
VLNRGSIEQVGTPEALYERPRTRFVGDFLAVRNILEATVESVAGGEARVRTRGGAAFAAADDGGYAAGASVVVGIRPERITLDGGSGNALPGTLDDEIYLGDRTDWRVRLCGETVTVAEGASTASARKRGDAVTVRFPPEAVLRLEEPQGP